MGIGGFVAEAVKRIEAQQARDKAQQAQQARDKAQQAQEAQQKLAQQLAEERARPPYNPYRETTYSGSEGAASPGVVVPRAAEEAAIRTGSKFAGPRPPPPADMERWLEGGFILPPVQPVMQSVSPMQQRYDPYRATTYAGNQGVASPGVVLPTGILQAQYSPNYGRRRMRQVRTAADGGSITEFPRKTGPINGPGTGTSDDIPAMLSDGEFVFTARAVRNAGDGSRRKGAARMYKLMKSLEKGGMVKG
jgi:hypothetical protein